MACSWITNNTGEVIGALTEDGKKSNLFDELLKQYDAQQAQDLYEASRSDAFKEIYPAKEATPEQVVRFVTEENQSKRELSAEQKVAVRNFGIADTENLKERLLDAFYDNEGVFFVSESKLVNSGLYSAYEASNLKNDISLQEKVKSALEAFKNTSDVYSEDISDDQVDKINTFNSFGKLVKVKKEAEPLQSVETFQEIDGQLVEEPVDNVDLLLSYKSAEENQELEDDLNVLLTVSDEVLLRNEATKTVLENVERLAIADGLDLIGLADKQFDRTFMQSLLDFVISPNKENTANFSQEYKRLFQKNSEVKLTGLNREVDNKEYVVVNTTLSEQEVYKQKGFIKVEDNLHIKTNSQPLEELYEVVRTYTEKYPKEMTLEQYVQQETGKLQGFTNPEIAEAVVLYKMYFEGVKYTSNKKQPLKKGVTDFYNKHINIKTIGSVEQYSNYLNNIFPKTKTPNIVYHGTSSNTIFDKFDRYTRGVEKGGAGDRGIFFAGDIGRVYTDKIIYAILNIENLKKNKYRDQGNEIKKAEKEGYNGVYANGILKEMENDPMWEGMLEEFIEEEYVVFDPNNIHIIGSKKDEDMFKEYLNNIKVSSQVLKKSTLSQNTSNFTGNYEYLTEDFPADFYKEMLVEKKKDSVKYNNYYVHFGIDEKGIYLNEVDSNTLENIKDFADENMKQYSVISKRITNIAEQTEEVFSTEQTRRDEAINNPNSVEKFTGEYVKTASDNVIAKNTQKEFIKVENEIYELWDDLGNLSMYTKVASNNSPYFAVNTKKTGTNEDLNSYTHLLTTPEKFINYKKNNEVEGFEC